MLNKEANFNSIITAMLIQIDLYVKDHIMKDILEKKNTHLKSE